MKMDFKEKQKFTQWWLWLIIIGLGIIPVYGLYVQLVQGEGFGDKPMSDTGLIVPTMLSIGIIVLFRVFTLTTEINSKEIRIAFFPFVNKKIAWENVKSAQVLNYGFVGGWGIRLFTKYGTVYNIKGNMGLALELNNGKKLLVGTQKMEELSEVIAKILSVQNPN
ncbi:hypothetical protein [Flavobacterium sp. UMI-01]|uniref:hypothetical protein n=1 Tax=Flavobacterium sp. UMI-01 TaxID=1441053 RepID=UPI00207EB91B|nr:hypothetical protein [Flavobacterium sp. UMI-01]GIZ07786.1 hypothetical protein FUMI01_05130 [Flavobacterium sp. UMI-01]